MRTAVQLKTASYIKLNNDNIPINLVPAGIKCLECQQFYTPMQLKSHLSTHVNPQYINAAPLYNASIPDKINLQRIEDPEKLEQIWVKSVLPQQMPQVQQEKKVARRLLGSDVGILHNPSFTGLNKIEPAKDLSSDIGDTADSVEQVDRLQVRKNIELNLVQNLIDRKQIHFYKSQHGVPVNIDNTVIRQRKHDDTETEVSDGYQAVPIQEQKVGQFKLTSRKKQNRQTYVLGSSLKNPSNPLRISTLSRRIVQPEEKSQYLQKSTVSPYRSTHNNQVDNVDYQLMCRCCKGFYCQQCKSSVPPIYRPVPDRDGNYHFHPQQNQRAVQFYRDHYYANISRVCTHCSKDYLGEERPDQSRKK